LGGSVIGRGAKIEAGAWIDNSIIGDGSVVGPRARISNSFIAPGFSVPGDVIAEGNYFGF
jgi:mannose-1-phosphate guanylyltransferase